VGSSAQPFQLYVHVPFCNYACRFCFYSKRIGAPAERKIQLVEAIAQELRDVPRGTPLLQLYVGGGTPTALAPNLLDQLLADLFGRYPRVSTCPITIESSPESLAPDHIRS